MPSSPFRQEQGSKEVTNVVFSFEHVSWLIFEGLSARTQGLCARSQLS